MKTTLFGMVIILIISAFAIGWDKGKRHIRVEACEAGVAKWAFTDNYGTREFQWVKEGK